MLFGLTATAQAALIPNGNGTVTDTDTNLMWLQDANYAKTSGHSEAGTMSHWWDARDWVDNLVFAGYDDWRLPTTPGTSAGYLDEGEMGHLYYDELGNSAGGPLASSGPFDNLQTVIYWTGTETPDPAWNNIDAAWTFNFSDGYQDAYNKYYSPWYGWSYFYVWPVRDVAAVPEPGSLLLLGSGLAGLLGLKRIKK